MNETAKKDAMNDASQTMPEKMPLTSMDIAEEKKEQLKRCLAAAFPEIMVEDKIDLDQLKRVLGEWVEPDRERFGLNWPGKAACMKVIQAPSVGTLKPCLEESVDWDATENLFIEGDNLEVLKLLQKAYFGKVKMIYIDPPYNTGNDFIYPDKYAETLDTYLEYTGQKDSEGRKFSTNTDASGRFHSRWLNMMYPRLYLAKNLLQENGLIFSSIDDNEQQNLRHLFDQIFGQENFVAQFVWKSRKFPDSRSKTQVSTDHEYVICYRKSEEAILRGIERDETKFQNPDDDPRGPWMSRSILGLATADQRPNLHYDIVDPATGISYSPPPERGWRYSKERMAKLISEGCILFPRKEDGRPREKKFKADLQNEFVSFPTVIDDIFTAEGTEQIRSLFGSQVFDFPKPSELISRLIKQGTEKDDIVLDFFAGSASTGESVINNNREDGGTRKFILVQLPESIEEGTEASKTGYRTLSALGRDRLRKFSAQIVNKEDGLDVGFRSFFLSTSNFRIWDGSTEGIDDADLIQQIEAHTDHLDPNASAEDILFELLLKDGFPLTVPIERVELAGKEVFSIAEGALLICLEKELTQELMDAMAEREPARVICLDAGFQGNDQLKANAVQTFKARARNKETAIEFRTV